MSAHDPLVLIVEDEPQMRRFLRAALTSRPFRILEASTSAEAVLLATSHNPELILLDLGLPDGDGIELARRIRGWSAVPIIVISARGRETDKVEALDAGADDYLTKPFSFRELLARIRALLRRDSQLRPEVFQLNDLVVDSGSHRVSRASREIELTAKEYALLEFLARRAGQLVSRTDIAAHVWDDSFDPFSNTIEVYMNRLRKKIDDEHAVKLLHTRRGEGYILESRN